MSFINGGWCVLLAGIVLFFRHKINKKDEKIYQLNELTLGIVTTIEEGFGILTDKVGLVNDNVNLTNEKVEDIDRLYSTVEESLERIKRRIISTEYRIDKLEMIGFL